MSVENPTERLHALDAVRAGALMLGVAFHATLSFLPGPQIWLVRDVPSEGLGYFFYVSHLFRMTAFFLIAGYFGRMLLHRRGTGGFIRNRLVRIAAPLLGFWPIVFTAVISCFMWGFMTMNGGTMPTDGPPPPPLTLQNLPLTHLWFLYVLIVFYVAVLVIRGVVTLVDRNRVLRERIVDPVMHAIAATPFAAPLLAAPLAAALATLPLWFPWGGIPTPDMGFVPNQAALTGFGTAFAFGWLLQRQRSLLGSLARWWHVQLIVALAATAACIWQVQDFTIVTPIAAGNAKTIYAATYALAVWSSTLALIGAALRFLTRERPAVRYVADASYWIYIVHLPVVMAAQVLVFGMDLPAVAKWALVTGGSFLILFASYHLLVRHSWIGRWLNGRKLPWRKRQPAMETQTA